MKNLDKGREPIEAKDIAIVKVGGYMEFTTADELDRVLAKLVAEKSYKIIIDLQKVDYISSRGWSIFLSKIKEVRENEGDLKLVNMSNNVFEVYKILEFFWFLKVCGSIEEAIMEFDQGIPPMPE